MFEDITAVPLNSSENIHYWTEKLLVPKNKKKVTIAFAVTDVSQNHKSEDYRRAEQLSIEFIKLGWKVDFLNRLKCQWYNLDLKIDILMTFSDLYDISKIETLNTNLIKIAWANKWYQQWERSPFLDQYFFIFGRNEESTTGQQKVSDNPLFHLFQTPEEGKSYYKTLGKQIEQEIINRTTKPTISLKIAARCWNGIHSWGDYHFAVLLKQQLDLNGFFVYLHVQSEWYQKQSISCDINLVLRGLRKHVTNPTQINIMWNISHPDNVQLDEYEDYDHVFIASTYWADHISRKVNVTIEPLLQCTDTDRFHPPLAEEESKYQHELLFVGNSRGIFRSILKDLLPTKHNLAIYGEHSSVDEIPSKYLFNTYLPNNELSKYYGSAKILLNDHWEDMIVKGFISNRIYDGIASGAFIISDRPKKMGEVETFIVTYKTRSELKKLISFYLNNPDKRKEIIQDGRKFIKKNHTFKERAEAISQTIFKILINKNNL